MYANMTNEALWRLVDSLVAADRAIPTDLTAEMAERGFDLSAADQHIQD